MIGVSFVVPVHNGAACVGETIASILAQSDGRPMEIIVVEDGSRDNSAEVLESMTAVYPLTVIAGPGRGAAAAVNVGVRIARYPLICQVDQDVVLEPGWLTALVACLSNPAVAAAQGRYIVDGNASFFARITALDLEQRYADLEEHPNHVCTGNTVYRASALHAIGLLDDSMGYGYDNDLSYRLQAAGYRLAFCRAARSRHRWREGWSGYLAQQYGFGYGRLDVVARHPQRWMGDAVSPASMMAHPLVMAMALCLLGAGGLLATSSAWSNTLVTAGLALVLVLAIERTVTGVRLWKRFGDPAALAFPLVHLARDVAWVAAVLVWTYRRVLRRGVRPEHSMMPRAAAR
jgi:cellulose synthase/poly-beta-1,6-N-acetylglucosamine synthase-like glycosyltransferase